MSARCCCYYLVNLPGRIQLNRHHRPCAAALLLTAAAAATVILRPRESSSCKKIVYVAYMKKISNDGSCNSDVVKC